MPTIFSSTRFCAFLQERTFIQWISAALLFITFSQLLYVLAANNGAKEAGVAGAWMLGMSLFITVYALVVYYRRVYLMQNGKHYGYTDFVGPGVLSASIISGIIMLIVFTNRAQSPSESVSGGLAASLMKHEPGQCIRRSLSGVPIIETQPSGAVVDEETGLLLVPSLNRIFAMKDGLPTDEENEKWVHIVATLPGGTDIESLEYVDGNIFALSERAEGSDIISLEWKKSYLPDGGAGSGENIFHDEMVLEEVHRWKVATPGGEGMAVVPSNDREGKFDLLIAGGQGEGANVIDIYDLDAFSSSATEVKKKSMMNGRLLANGIKKTKRGSMHFFEGLLYMLYDNERIIRSFDIATGAFIQDYPLPVTEIGSEKQWEGMRLQRLDDEGGSSLRGSVQAGSPLVLHLALDTPAQVWSIKLNEEAEAGIGRWAMPDCAVQII